MKCRVYADNAATTKVDKNVVDEMLPWLCDEYGNASQPYHFGKEAKEAISRARLIIAECINASPDEIYFTSGGTESDNWAIKGIALQNLKDFEVITSTIEHHAILNSCQMIENLGGHVNYINSNSFGEILPENLIKQIKQSTKLVSIMMANNEIGSIQPVSELCEIAHHYGALFHTDAVQAMGHIPIDVKKLNIDLLSASAHKFNGPKGVGFLYVNENVKIKPFMNGGSQESELRAGTENVASIVGMARALRNNCDSLHKNAILLQDLEDCLISGIKKIPNINYIQNGSFHKLPGLVSLSFKNYSGEAILHSLDLMGICISTGAACNSRDTHISHVLKAINLNEFYANGTIRISFGKNNTLNDVEVIVSSLKKVLTD